MVSIQAGHVCQTCSRAVTSISSRLVCEQCCKMEHLVCLRQSSGPLPTPLLGDTFFTLLCSKCSPTGREVIKRDRVNWLTALTVAIYNLRKNSPHLGREGFFHWKLHVSTFLEKHWNILLGPQMKKRKTWLGTISGTLSHWSGEIFRSGSGLLKETGWWTLVDERLPADLIANATANSARGQAQSGASLQQQKLQDQKRAQQSLLLTKNTPSAALIQERAQTQGQPASPLFAVTPDQPKRTRGVQSSILTAMALKEKRATLSEAKDIRKAQQQIVRPMASCSSLSSESPVMLLPVMMAPQSLPKVQPASGRSSRRASTDDERPSKMLRIEVERSEDPVDLLLHDDDESGFELADLDLNPNMRVSEDLTSSLSQHTTSGFGSSMDELISSTRDSLPNVEELVSKLGSVGPELTESFDEQTSLTDEDSRDLVDRKTDMTSSIELPESKVPPLCRYDEEILLQTLEKQSRLNDVAMRQLRRKLKVRKQLRSHGLPVFDFDQIVRKIAKQDTDMKQESILRNSFTDDHQANPQILDRFQVAYESNERSDQLSQTLSLRDRLLGRDPYDWMSVTSPVTNRVLKPFIRRDFKMRPIKLRLFDELYEKLRPGEMIEKHPIDFMYVRPHHIPSVNQLAREFFWPGIDLSECLQYPDFSCVVVYRRIVVGFAFMVPDVSQTEAYISFIFVHPEWRRVGIAKFMVYHLCQTCMGKDITLHVSANNPAVLLYQQFGFKVEEYVQNFYDKYLPITSTECKNALFMRLLR